ncbi:replicative DNA helicase [Mahella australiensis]|uniref:DNA 5'-3' helicase n=1 Tax=Mahella australiensis (strain DSM 15567 / CIP 107919 / 50-1 BON) TaxID=697281 RepID=F3ZZE9_MAHA5|nr:DnaB-like helicase C-terminal domain-containing protein [Mahella australiensis]AEE95759.1 DnaB domain protein helicase domain protein [Mahella australiensis 50-1 BON]
MIQAIEAEQEVLAAILLEPNLAVYLDELEESYFNDNANLDLFKTMLDIYKQGKPVNTVTVAAAKRELVGHALKITGDAFVAGFEQHLQVLKDAATMRQAYLQAQKIANMAEKMDDANEVLSYALNVFNGLVPSDKKAEDFKDVVLQTLEEIEDRYRNRDKKEYYMNSLSAFNIMTAGLHRSEFHIIAARPSVGKTAFALQLAEDIARNGVKVLFFSREMSKTQLVERMIARRTGVGHWNIRTGNLNDDDWEKLSALGLPLGTLPLVIDTESATVEDMKLKAMSMPDVGLIVIDYLQLVSTKRRYDSRSLEVGHISRELKELSMKMNIPVVALAQINRDAANKRPGLENLAESGKLEQDADNVYFLHRPDEQPLWQEKKLLYIELIAAKQRQAPIGMMTIIFNPDWQAFYDLDKTRENSQEEEIKSHERRENAGNHKRAYGSRGIG